MQLICKDAKEKRSVLEPLDFWLLKGCGAGGKGEETGKGEKRPQYRVGRPVLSSWLLLLTNVSSGGVVIAVVVAKGAYSIERRDICCCSDCYF